MEDTLVLTPSALFSFLSQIEELQDKEIQVENSDRDIEVRIGDNVYSLQPGTELSDVDPEVIDTLDEINDNGYNEEIPDNVVEGGIIKELIKTLAIGGLVRLTKNALTS